MLLILGLAATAALAVVLYNRLADYQPEMVDSATRRTAQLAAVVLVLSQAVEGVAEALQATVHRRPARPAPSGWGSARLIDNEWEDDR